MYKASFANGDSWHEWIKMEPGQYSVYKINGDGSHVRCAIYDRSYMASKATKALNHKYCTPSAFAKVAAMTDGHAYLAKEDYAKYQPVRA